MKGTMQQGGFTDYLTVYDGKFAKRVKEPTENSTTRVTKSDKTVHEVYYDFVGGLFTGIEKRDSEYGFNLVIRMEEADEKNEITFKFYDRATRTVLNKLINVDFSAPATLLVGKNDEGYTWFSIKQTGKGYEKDIVPGAFTKEQVPAPEKIRVQGKETWNFDGQADFLWNALKKKMQERIASPVQEQLVEADATPDLGVDDLPF